MIKIKDFNDKLNNKNKFNGNEFMNNVKDIKIKGAQDRMRNNEEATNIDTQDYRQQEKADVQDNQQNKMNFNNRNDQTKFNSKNDQNFNDSNRNNDKNNDRNNDKNNEKSKNRNNNIK